MSVRADFGFSDATPQIICQGVPEPGQEPCGLKFYGDAVVDAFRNWWKHQAEVHPGAHE